MDERKWGLLTEEVLEAFRRMRLPHHGQRDFGMIGQQMILNRLFQNGGELTPGELARLCQVSTARVARVCAQLEEQGLVHRIKDSEDGRRTLVQLSAEGTRVAQERLVRIETSMRGFLQELGEHDAQELVRIMQKAAPLMVEYFGRGACCPVSGVSEGEDR